MKLDPLHQFVVQPFQLGNITFPFTNSAFFMILAVICICAFFMLFLRKITLMPSTGQAIAELPLVLIKKMIDETIGKAGYPFISFIASIFLFVLVGNTLGMFPYSFTFTSQLIINFSLASLVLGVITVVGFIKHGTKFLRLFCPPGTPWWVSPLLVPIELISYLARPLSLSIRLFANMVAGHSMLKIFTYFTVSMKILGLFPLAINVLLIGFEFFVSFLQAYVFTMLSCIYLHDVLDLH